MTTNMRADAHCLLQVNNLNVTYPTKGFRNPPYRALDDVSLTVHAGETVGLVGESGSGKTTLGRAILGLAPVRSGEIRYQGRDISHLSGRGRRALSSEIQVIFQDPYTSLNPMMTIGQTLTEPLIARQVAPSEADRTVRNLLEQVGLPRTAAARLPRDFSGGQRQRIAIARALALRPKLIICDEPTSALDLSTQSLILELLVALQERSGVAFLFISHDLAVVRHMSHRVAVMRAGKIVECGEGGQVTTQPEHPYTQRLLLAAPVADPDRQAERRRQRHSV